jgi:hypothetical protein
MATGAGQGLSETVVRDIVDTLKRETPPLISQLRESVDHNIITAEEASERLVTMASKVLSEAAGKTADQVIKNVRTEVDAVEKKFLADIDELLKKNFFRLHCETAGAMALLDRQRAILSASVDSWIDRLPFAGRRRNDVITQCRAEYAIPEGAKEGDFFLTTRFKLWRCFRLHFVDENSSPADIRDAFVESESFGFGVLCALQSEVGRRDVAEISINDAIDARVWDRAVRGE